MSLKSVIFLVSLVLIAVYFALLNPGDIKIHLTQTLTLKTPLVVFLMSCLLIGGVLVTAVQSLDRFKRMWGDMREAQAEKKQENRYRRWEKMYNKAQNAIATGRLPKGVALFEKILNEHPTHLGVLYHLGNHHRNEGRYDEAIELHQRAVTADPENIKGLHSLAEDYFTAGYFDREIETLQRILDKDPNSLPTLRKLREAYLKARRPQDAYLAQKSILPLIHEPEELRHEQDLFAKIIYSIGWEQYQGGKVDGAINEFKRALRENDRSQPAYISLGDIYKACDNPKLALKTWKNGFEMTRSPVLLKRMEHAYREMGKLDDIDKIYTDALSRAEASEKGTLTLLYCSQLLENGRKEAAVEILETLEPQSLLTRLLTTHAYRVHGDAANAEAHLSVAIDQVLESISGFTCKDCGKASPEWHGFCPSCKAWDTLGCGPLPVVA